MGQSDERVFKVQKEQAEARSEANEASQGRALGTAPISGLSHSWGIGKLYKVFKLLNAFERQ